MRRLTALVLALAIVTTGCTGDSDDPSRKPTTATTDPVTLETLDLDWPKAEGKLDPPELPAAPEGFDAGTLDRMAKVLTKWAALTVANDGGWHTGDPLSDVRNVLPKPVAGIYEAQLRGEVSPRLAVANVFGDDVTVVGSPRITSAWRVSIDQDPANETFMQLELQTRAAYEVRLGDGPSRVIGVLRVQFLTAYPDTTDDFGIGGGWQEFGAGDCALALDDALVPESDRGEALDDLQTFIKIGNSDKLEMPELPVQEQVDDEYLKRCRDGRV